MKQLETELTQLRRSQNSVAPVNRLAPELFYQIFKYLVEPATSKDGRMLKASFSVARLKPLIWITHVCYHWREIALGAATLWTAFPLHNPSLALAFISRSRSSPLHLNLDLPERHSCLYQIIDEIILPNIPRMRTLIINVRDFENLRQVVRKLRVPALQLEELMIRQIKVNTRGESRPMVDLGRHLFAGELPSLKTFSTRGVDIPLTLRGPNTLVNLSIHSNPSLADKPLIDLLAQCPGLESLKIKESDWFSIRRGPAYIDWNRPVISLPHLKRLQLDFYLPERAAALLHHISVPNSTQFHIDVSYHGFDINPGYHMFPRNASENLKFLDGVKRVEVFNTLGTDPTSVEIAFIVRAYHDASSFDDPAIEIRARMAPLNLTGAFLGSRWPFDVSGVETFVVSGLIGDDLAEDVWRTTLAEMDSVRTIRVVDIRQSVASDLASCLGEASNARGDRIFALCPALSTLELVEIRGLEFVLDNSLKPMIVARVAAGTLKELDLFNVTCFGGGSSEVKEIREKCGSSITLRVDELD